ncbi:MAG: peptidoglycan bridge formation glycyltransferase FemA/FemB family protein [Candidatus Colwellbacteria bacterium]|nr:peptidoglycan bridge formation glycyltransferase FemA/FemB family protein [Candidatus Colwellbacteria bacterium]
MTEYKVRGVASKEEWEAFILSHPEANFLQSWNWGVFHQNLGKKIFRIGLYENDRLSAIALCIKEVAKRGTYLTIAGGPIPFSEPYVGMLMRDIKKIAEEEGCDFIRLRPQELDSEVSRETARTLGLRKSPLYLTADLTLQLDIQQPEEELLRQMRKSTRYEIKRAEREKIEVKISKDPADIHKFYEHEVALAKKQHFVPFSYKFLHEQFKAFVQNDQAALFHAYKNHELLASAFIIFYNSEAVYHYGVSTPANTNWPGAHACQWAAIQEARRRGLGRYNFWGVAPKNEPGHRFAHLSVFKRGFGGEEVQYLPAHDLPISRRYSYIRLFELLRKTVRRV